MNRLQHEKSPYLLQHQHNPVDWFPWGEEAFTKAREEQKPVFLSIGYSTCHWCHVMERESFENATIAALLNRYFVPIKVDREERPDVDRVYMTFVQATTGGGGWPLNVFLTSELHPFFGGTYFPPEDRWGRQGFPEILKRLAHAWENDRPRLLSHGAQVIEALREQASSPTPPSESIAAQRLMTDAATHFRHQFDDEWGGFGDHPKFPRPSILSLLFRTPESGKHPSNREMAFRTLDHMASGGIYDHLGGGFHRYSVDRHWHIPHFEKMLYDQAQLVVAFLEGFQLSRNPRYAEVAQQTLDYVHREMRHPEGGFYSAQDADSPLPEDPSRHGEGAFFIWTEQEIRQSLPSDDADLFCRIYGVTPHGNAPEGSDPHGEFTGKNTLYLAKSAIELAKEINRTEQEILRSLVKSHSTLLQLREHRPHPHLDDKILTSWNGLMISAFSKAHHLLQKPNKGTSYLEIATLAADFLRSNLYRGGKLLRSWRGDASTIPAFADDYAFLIAGLLDLYEAGAGIQWLQWAETLQDQMDASFYDAEHGGYFSTTGTDPSILIRQKEEYDGAEPAPNSITLLNLYRLHALTGRPLDHAKATLAAFSSHLEQHPTAMPQLLAALAFASSSQRELIISGPDPSPFQQELARHFAPVRCVLYPDQPGAKAWLAPRLPHLAHWPEPDGLTRVAICEEKVCQAPVDEVAAFRAQLH